MMVHKSILKEYKNEIYDIISIENQAPLLLNTSVENNFMSNRIEACSQMFNQ